MVIYLILIFAILFFLVKRASKAVNAKRRKQEALSIVDNSKDLLPFSCTTASHATRVSLANETYDSVDDPSRPHMIDGKKVKTDEDWQRWWIIRDFSVSIGVSLNEVEEQIKTAKCDNVEEAYSDWQELYTRLRNLCIKHSLWNVAIQDREPFIPTEWQIKKEETLKLYMQACYQEGLKRQRVNQEKEKKYVERQARVLDYLAQNKGGDVVRHAMIDSLSQDDPTMKKEYLETCIRMVKEKVLSESRNDSGRITIKKRRKSNKSSEPSDAIIPTTFRESWYSLIPQKTIYKVQYTVGQPIDLNKEANAAVFKSLSSRNTYHTSLEACTCHAFVDDSTLPCKHMVALAIHLGFPVPGGHT